MYLKIFLLSIVLVSFAFLGLATQILLKRFFLKKKGHFPITSVGRNPNMRKLGLRCEKCEELKRCKELIKAKKTVDCKE